jgi:16S rRNA (cytidine1402-2'-O)-methyltransferase
MEEKKPKLILLPNLLHEEEADFREFLPIVVEEKIALLDGLIAESEKEARRYLKRFSFPEGKTFREVPLLVLNEHTQSKELPDLLEPILRGQTWGLISDAGLPCLADPGANLVALARQKGVLIEAVSGPSSLFLALMLSGLSAQRFCFRGYLERESDKLSKEIKILEKQSSEQKMTMVCIEAPYRVRQLFDALVKELEPSTKLCIALDLTSTQEEVHTCSVSEWRKKTAPSLHKRQAIFLFAG